jgi:hypothetical protein
VKRVILVLLLPLATACSANGWTAYPVDELKGCIQVEEWETHGFLDSKTRTTALGVYCRAEVVR